MATFTNTSRNSASFSNTSRNSASFANTDKSDSGVFGELTFDQVGSLALDGTFQGKAVSDYTFDDPVFTTIFANQTRN